MAAPQDKFANSPSVLKTFQDEGIVAIHSKNMTRAHRQRLLKNGFIEEVMKGWYIQSSGKTNRKAQPGTIILFNSSSFDTCPGTS